MQTVRRPMLSTKSMPGHIAAFRCDGACRSTGTARLILWCSHNVVVAQYDVPGIGTALALNALLMRRSCWIQGASIVSRIKRGFLVGLILAGTSACEDDDMALADTSMQWLDAGPMSDASQPVGDGAQSDAGVVICSDTYRLVADFFFADPALVSLRTCENDRDCALWEQSFRCRGATNVTVSLCGGVVAATQVERADVRVLAFEAELCPRVIGPSCFSSPTCARLRPTCGADKHCAAAIMTDGGL